MSTQNVEKDKSRLIVLERIAEYEKKGWFSKDVEDDPPTIPLTPDKVDYLNKKLKNKIATFFVNIVAVRFIKNLVKNGQMVIKEIKGIENYEAVGTNGTEETRNLTDYSKNGKGGLKILFSDKAKNPVAYIWMRGSGTEPVFRVLCDVKGENPAEEHELLDWERSMILKADEE